MAHEVSGEPARKRTLDVENGQPVPRVTRDDEDDPEDAERAGVHIDAIDAE